MDNSVGNYIGELLKTSKLYLKNYHLDSFDFSDFELINFLLIDKVINSGISKSFLINLSSKNQRKSLYIPALLSSSISLLYKNFCHNAPKLYVGDILQDDYGKRFEIESIGNTEPKYILISHSDIGIRARHTTKSVFEFIKVTDKNLSSRAVKTKFSNYRGLIKLVINEKITLSEFKYKAVIILEKKEFLTELRKQTITDIDISKAIPFQWVNKNGKYENKKIPIDPMIYIVPDYETFKEYIFESEVEIDTIIIIGKNKYKQESFRQLKRDLREEEIPNIIIIGVDNIDDPFSHFCKWNWTAPEIALLNNHDMATISVLLMPNDEFQNKILDFSNMIIQLNSDFSIELPNFNGFKKLLYFMVFPNQNGRLQNQTVYLIHLITKIYTEAIIESLFNQNIESGEQIKLVEQAVVELLGSHTNAKLQAIEEGNFDYLVLPDKHIQTERFSDIWQNESKFAVLGYKEFIKKQDSFKSRLRIFLISPFTYEQSTYEFLDFLKMTVHDYTFLAYEEEKDVITNLTKRYENKLALELNSQDRVDLLNIKFPYEHQPETISDLIERLDKESIGYYCEYNNECIYYQLDFINGESLTLEHSKSILLESGNIRVKYKVGDLKKYDKVRVYLNETNDLLYKLAIKKDENKKFKEIECYSKLWKECLLDYFSNQDAAYSKEDLLQVLKEKGISIGNIATLTNWLNINSNIKFPHKAYDLYVLERTIKSSILSEKIEGVIRSGKIYNGVMISLGRDLSDEVMDYIIDKKKGEILSEFSDYEIKSLVQKSAPLNTIKQIHIIEGNDDEEQSRL